MHPKSGILALHGVLPMMYEGRVGAEHLRLRWNRNGREFQLSHTGGRHNRLGEFWELTRGDNIQHYDQITWEEIPDEIMDSLSMDLIEKFLETF